jgi:nucleotide-binding universal stress UspA family protein
MIAGAGTTYRPPRHETVLVGVTASAASAAATRWAAAKAARRGARLHAVHVVEQGGTLGLSPHRDLRLDLDLARRTVPGRVGGWLFRAGIDVEVAVSVVTGDAVEQLAREAADASLVIIGAPDSLRDGALPADLAVGCLCPVVVVGALGDVTHVDVPRDPSLKGASRARP